jgi:hypothetical protein
MKWRPAFLCLTQIQKALNASFVVVVVSQNARIVPIFTSVARNKKTSTLSTRSTGLIQLNPVSCNKFMKAESLLLNDSRSLEPANSAGKAQWSEGG